MFISVRLIFSRPPWLCGMRSVPPASMVTPPGRCKYSAACSRLEGATYCSISVIGNSLKADRFFVTPVDFHHLMCDLADAGVGFHRFDDSGHEVRAGFRVPAHAGQRLRHRGLVALGAYLLQVLDLHLRSEENVVRKKSK